MSRGNEPAPQCKWCDAPAARKCGRIRLCRRHARLSQMSATARYRGNLAPSRAELEAMVPSDMRCSSCERTMNWFASDGADTVIVLQHDRAGTVRMICQSCNARHGQMPGDSFYHLPKGKRQCPDCKEIKDLTDFWKDRSGERFGDAFTYCKDCHNRHRREYRALHRETVNAKRRSYYHARKEAGNPIPQRRNNV